MRHTSGGDLAAVQAGGVLEDLRRTRQGSAEVGKADRQDGAQVGSESVASGQASREPFTVGRGLGRGVGGSCCWVLDLGYRLRLVREGQSPSKEEGVSLRGSSAAKLDKTFVPGPSDILQPVL